MADGSQLQVPVFMYQYLQEQSCSISLSYPLYVPQMSQNWAGWENCCYWYIWRERLSFTGSLTGASWTSTKMNTKSCIVNKQPQMPWDSAANPDGQQIEHVPAYPFGINAYLHICIAKAYLRGWGMCLFPSVQHWRDPTWNAISRFELLQTDKTTWSTGWRSPAEDQEDG